MRYAVLDTETTGVKLGTDRVIELAVAAFDDGSTIGTLYGLHNPGIPVPAEASAVHGWLDEHLAEAPSFTRKSATELLEFLRDVDGPIYVHNADFDRGILAGEFARVGADVAALQALPWCCTLKMARELWPGQANDLSSVAARLGVEPDGQAHSAKVDVDTLSRCVAEMVHRYAYRGHKGELVKATTAVPAVAVSDGKQVESLTADTLAALTPRVTAAQQWVATYKCEDSDDEQNGHEALGQLKRLQAEAEAKRKGLVEPIKKVAAAVDQAFRDLVTKPCDQARTDVEHELGTYAAKRLAEQRQAELEARRKLETERAKADAEARAARKAELEAQAEAARLKAELDKAELEARRAGDAEAVAKAEAAKLQIVAEAMAKLRAEVEAEAERQAKVQQAQQVAVAAATSAGPVKGATSTGGYSSVWLATITDPGKVPDIYWAPDLAMVQRAVDNGARQIPGVEIVEQLVVSNRRKR